MKFSLIICLAIGLAVLSCKEDSQKDSGEVINNPKIIVEPTTSTISITPIQHATMVLKWNEKTLYIDPTGGVEAFEGFSKPDLILITDIHGDHMDPKTLNALDIKDIPIIVPQAVAEQLPEALKNQTKVLNNGETTTALEIGIEAIPMYNLREEALKFHTKGRGNGYVLTFDKERVYISGDTEDIPEMRALKNIDIAFVCMNLPYTMTVDSAASAVLEFKPKTVYPYHYRGTDGLSDVTKFKNSIQEGNPNINIMQLDWYATK